MGEAQPLPDDAVVVRGGVPTAEGLRDKVREEKSYTGLFGLSVQAAPGVSIETLVGAGNLPHKQIGVTTARELRQLGERLGVALDVVATPLAGMGFHATLKCPNPLPFDIAEQLVKAFRVQPNPCRAAPRRRPT